MTRSDMDEGAMYVPEKRAVSEIDAWIDGCPICDEGWICENHPDKAWPGDCCGGAGSPCVCNPLHNANIARESAIWRQAAEMAEAEASAAKACLDQGFPDADRHYERLLLANHLAAAYRAKAGGT